MKEEKPRAGAPASDPEWEEKKKKSWQRQDYFEHLEGDDISETPKANRAATFIKSFGFAADGILFCVIRERNMRFDVIVSAIVLIISLFFNFNRFEFALLSITMILVLSAEMFNTAIEHVCDLVAGDEYNKFVKIAKDVAAGAVMLTAANAVIVGYLLFFDKFSHWVDTVYLKIRHNPAHTTFIAVGLVLILVILAKALWYRGHGRPLHGGSVSGHTAIAFCLATIAAFLVDSTSIAVISYVIALLVAESRYEAHIHTFGEIVFGGILGTLVAGTIFMLFGK